MVAATIIFNSAVANSERFGLTLKTPFIFATLTSEIGPSQNILEQLSAVDAAKAAKVSGMVSASPEYK